MIMAFANQVTVNGLNVLIFVAFVAYGEATTFSVVSEDGGDTLNVVRQEERVSFSSTYYATAQLSGNIQQSG